MSNDKNLKMNDKDLMDGEIINEFLPFVPSLKLTSD